MFIQEPSVTEESEEIYIDASTQEKLENLRVHYENRHKNKDLEDSDDSQELNLKSFEGMYAYRLDRAAKKFKVLEELKFRHQSLADAIVDE